LEQGNNCTSQKEKIMKQLSTLYLAIICAIGFTSSNPSFAELESKGVVQCNQPSPENRCIVVAFNTKTPETDADETAYRMTLATLKKNAAEADVGVSYRFSGAIGSGRSWALDNGSTLASGDKFKVFVEFHQDTCLYLVQFDTHGQFNELLELSERSNCQSAGTRLILPAENMSFTLDDKTGQETIHTIASRSEIIGLKDDYQNQIGQVSQGMIAQYSESKGILVTVDSLPPGQNRSVVCPKADACRDEFVIHHVAHR
jgi:hypothetical protein